MISTEKGFQTSDIPHGGQHILFVEGNKESIDIKVLHSLFKNRIRIEPLGPSFSVKSVAEALYRHHPTYYFLIDRDHHSDEEVEESWKNFPDPEKHNLLIWRKKEIENYFIDPDYLSKSRWLKKGKGEELKEKILFFANERLYLDTVNLVITAIRFDLRKTWIRNQKNPHEFKTKESSLEKLKECNAFNQHRKNVCQKISQNEIEKSFFHHLNEMTGGSPSLEYGSGKWMDRISGKEVLSQVLNSSFFAVVDAKGNALDKKEQRNQIVKELLRISEEDLPPDFVELKRLIIERVKG